MEYTNKSETYRSFLSLISTLKWHNVKSIDPTKSSTIEPWPATSSMMCFLPSSYTTKAEPSQRITGLNPVGHNNFLKV